MLEFPMCRHIADGLVYNIRLYNGCTLHVPLAMCKTQKEQKDLSSKVTEFALEQQDYFLGIEVKEELIKLAEITDKLNKLNTEAAPLLEEKEEIVQKIQDMLNNRPINNS